MQITPINFCCTKGGILHCVVLYFAPLKVEQTLSQSLNILQSPYFLKTLQEVPLSRWVLIYVIMFLFEDFYVGRREIAPQNLHTKPGQLEKVEGWGTVKLRDKILSIQ